MATASRHLEVERVGEWHGSSDLNLSSAHYSPGAEHKAMKSIVPQLVPTCCIASMLALDWFAAPAGSQDKSTEPTAVRLQQAILSKQPVLNGQIRFAGQGTRLIAIVKGGLREYEAKTGALSHTWEGSILAFAI